MALVRMMRAEVGILRALWWAFRGRRAVEPGDVPLPYADRFGVLLWGLTGLGALEIVIVHLLLPWPVLRWILLIAGGYGLVWCVGFVCSLRQHPHVLRGGELLLRFGHFRTTVVPLSALTGARQHVRSDHRRAVAVDGDVVSFSVMGDTNLTLALEPPVEIEVKGQLRPAARIELYADDPRAVTELLRSVRSRP